MLPFTLVANLMLVLSDVDLRLSSESQRRSRMTQESTIDVMLSLCDKYSLGDSGGSTYMPLRNPNCEAFLAAYNVVGNR